MRQSEKPSHLAPRRKGTTSLGRTGGVVVEVRPAGIWRYPAEVCVDPVEHCSQTHVRGALPGWPNVPIGALKGGRGGGRPPARAVAIAPDGTAVHSADLSNPLIEQNTGRDETQRAQPRPVHGGEGEPSLAAPGREGNDATAVPQVPGGQSCLLIGTEVDIRPRLL